MEVLQVASRAAPRTLDELARVSGVPKTTLLRILNTLVETGYVSKTRKKRYVANFQLTKLIPLDSAHHRHLEAVLETVSRETGQTAEIITVTGKSLYWYDRFEPAGFGVRVAAQRGFRRTLYELDAPSRLYLSRIGIDKVGEEFDRTAFYTAMPQYAPVSWDAARALIRGTKPDCVAFDQTGNRNGIRRFATAITSKQGAVLYLLAIAEPAVVVSSWDEYAKRLTDVLIDQRQRLQDLPHEIEDPDTD